jgi:hypothetical protein
LFGRERRQRARYHEDIDGKTDQLLDDRQRRFPVQLRVSTLDDDILVLDPSPLPQPVDECLPPQIDERGASRYV